ncbi:hypothetical protein RHSIM_Rhsim03G0230000 [Rhododendron simsii]|uniref:Uncharacterized protein n=1 Tax=Rhododendron simsii TaxID=118357 RepID=A0A834H5E5_RHOSS|nr:hypothetical protein RHSIM_Rhsim03G0230000 [Rhododendron simsii]
MSFLFGNRKTPAELLRENKRMLDKSIREIERERQGLQTQEKKLIVEMKKNAKQGQMQFTLQKVISLFCHGPRIEAILRCPHRPYRNAHHANREIFKKKKKKPSSSLLSSGFYPSSGSLSGAETTRPLEKKMHQSLWPYLITLSLSIDLALTKHVLLVHVVEGSIHGNQKGAVKIMAKDLIRTRHQIEKFYKLKSQLQGVALRIQTLKSTQAMGEAMKGVTKAMGQMNRQMNLPALQKIMQEFERQNEKMEMVTEVMGDAIDDALEGDEEEEETEELVNQVLDEIGIDMKSELLNAPSSAVAAPAAAKNKVAQAEATGSDDTGIDSDLQARLDNLRKM